MGAIKNAASTVTWPVRFIWGQILGWIGSVAGIIRGIAPIDLLPPSVLSTIRFIGDKLPQGLGFTNGPKDHIVGSVVFSVFLVVASLSVLTYVAVVFLVVTLPFGLLRLWPVINRYWPLSPEMWPFWNLV